MTSVTSSISGPSVGVRAARELSIHPQETDGVLAHGLGLRSPERCVAALPFADRPGRPWR